MKSIAFALVALLLVLLPASLGAQTPDATGFEQSRFWKKLDADTRSAWQDAMQANDPERRFDCYVRVRAPADRGDRSFLEDNGFVVRMFSGNVASGHLPAKALPDVASLDFVDSIRLAKPPDSDVQKVKRPAE